MRQDVREAMQSAIDRGLMGGDPDGKVWVTRKGKVWLRLRQWKQGLRRAFLGSLLVVVLAGGSAGCDDPKQGRATAGKIRAAIAHVCGTTESREAGGPRTITPIDLDGKDGPTGYLVTCVNGQVEYVEATE